MRCKNKLGLLHIMLSNTMIDAGDEAVAAAEKTHLPFVLLSDRTSVYIST